MRMVFAIVGGVVLLLLAGVVGVVAFNAPSPPVAMKSVVNAFEHVDFRDMPAETTFTARDGTTLKYRVYPGAAERVAILVHGSSGASNSMHAVARALHDKGSTVYALTMRGHGGTGRSGDVDYIGQLDDDLADFLKVIGARKPGETRTLLGFSSGGGFVLRIAGGPLGKEFDKFILVSPQLPPFEPTSQRNAGGWVSVALGRFIALEFFQRAGITGFGHLPVLAFAVPPQQRGMLTTFYSYRMARNFGPTDGYKDDLNRAPAPMLLLIGAQDEIFLADQYAPLLKPVRPDISITLVPGLGHMDMTVKPPGLEALAAAAN